MTLPSIPAIAAEFSIDLGSATPPDMERILVEAMRRDLPLAVELLHKKAHEAQESGAPADWLEDPNSVIGRELIRLHASDALRPLAERHFGHSMHFTFINCCKGKVGREAPDQAELLRLQVACQVGPIAYADC